MEKIRIMVADGHPLYCEGICALLSSDAAIEVSIQALSGNEVIKKARDLSPDIILMDSALPPTSGVEVTRQLRAENIDCRVLLLTQQGDGLDVVSGFRSGVNGFISKNANHTDLLSAISSVSRGDYVIHLSMAGQVVHEYLATMDQPDTKHSHEELSQREREILDLVARGFRTRDIAGRLGIAAQTVSGHRASIMKKLGVHGQTEMVKYAILRRLTSVGGIEGSAPDDVNHS